MKTAAVVVFSFVCVTSAAAQSSRSFFMPNPASLACLEAGGSEETLADVQGNQVSVCSFGRATIDSWTLLRSVKGEAQAAVHAFLSLQSSNGSAGHGPTAGTGLANPASSHCIAVGGTSEILRDTQENEVGFCTFADGSSIEEWTLFSGRNDELNAELVRVLVP